MPESLARAVLHAGGMAERLEDLRVYQQAQAFGAPVDALLERPCYRKYRKLADQTRAASDSIAANISEGFEQGTDPAFARLLVHRERTRDSGLETEDRETEDRGTKD